MIAREFCRQTAGVYLPFKAIVLPVLHALLSAIIIASVWISMQGHARAESIVKPVTTIYYANDWPTTLNAEYSSPSIVCTALAASYNNSAGTADGLYNPDNNYCQILNKVTGITIYNFPLIAYALTCPDHAYRYSSGYGVNSASCACFAGYVADPSGTSCVSTTACPANSSGTYPDACTCNAGYEPNSAKTGCVPKQCLPPNVIDPTTHKCGPKCPVDSITKPPFSDACSSSLEEGKGVDVNKKCGTLREPDMVDAAACIAKKIKALSTPKITYSEPSATIRTAEYQDHLLEIWTKSKLLDPIMNGFVYTLETKQACAATYAAVLAEKQSHGIAAQPSSSGKEAPHVEHRAIDVPRRVANALMKQVTIESTTIDSSGVETTTITSNVEDYIHSATVNPPACDSKISWGGLFKRYDPVHFQLP